MASGNLHIIDVTQVDQGQYTCTAANHITGELIDGQRVLKLVVRGAPSRAKPLAMTWQPEERYIGQIGIFFFLFFFRLIRVNQISDQFLKDKM